MAHAVAIGAREHRAQRKHCREHLHNVLHPNLAPVEMDQDGVQVW
jgi:hypothetical protein